MVHTEIEKEETPEERARIMRWRLKANLIDWIQITYVGTGHELANKRAEQILEMVDKFLRLVG